MNDLITSPNRPNPFPGEEFNHVPNEGLGYYPQEMGFYPFLLEGYAEEWDLPLTALYMEDSESMLMTIVLPEGNY